MPTCGRRRDAQRRRRRRSCTASGWTRRWSRWRREFSRSHLQTLIERGHVQRRRRASRPPRRAGCAPASASRSSWCPPTRAAPSAPSRWRWRCVYEDEHLLVIDKPAGLVVHPAPGNWSGTLLNGLLAHHAGAAALPRAGIVHRLDKDTSGLMVVGKTLPAVTALVARHRRARRAPRATWRWRTARSQRRRFSVDAPIGRDPRSRVRMAVVAGGKRASRTDVRRASPSRRAASARCAARCTPAARTRSACTWRRAATRWWPTRCTAARRRSGCSGRRCMRPAAASRIRSRGEPLAFDCAPPADFAAAWPQVCDALRRLSRPPGTSHRAPQAAATMRPDSQRCRQPASRRACSTRPAATRSPNRRPAQTDPASAGRLPGARPPNSPDPLPDRRPPGAAASTQHRP